MYHLLAPSGGNHISLPGEVLPGRLTWGELAAAAAGVAEGLGRAGVGPGRVVAVEGHTAVEAVVAIFAAWRCGAAVTVLPPAPAGDPAPFARDLAWRRSRLDVGAAYLGDATAAGLDPAALAGVVPLDPARVAAAARTGPARPPAGDGAGAAPSGPGDVAVYQATSGTTRGPRLVPVTWSMLLANLAGITERLDLRRSDRFVSWMPLYHDMGLVLFLVLPAYLDAATALVPSARFATNPALWAAVAGRERATVTGMTTYGLALLERGLRRERAHDLSTLRSIVLGAEMIDLGLCDDVAATGRRHGLRPDVFACAYGLAEGTLGVSVHPPAPSAAAEEPPSGPGGGWLRPLDRGCARLGRPLSSVEVRIVPAAGRAELGQGGAHGSGRGAGPVGEIEIRGPSVMAGYVGEGDPRRPGGWLPTGDLGYLSGGEVVVAGRCKDVLMAGGRTLAPDDVERVVGRLACVRRGRVAAVADVGPAGEGFSVVAERARGTEPDARAVRVALRRQLGVGPLRVSFVAPGDLPRTTSGKLRRGAARALLGDPPDRRAVLEQPGRR
ncbi:MAG TPA: AMP-binding protein [Acidimicrobiales bacterium]|nr:AMP-binding protein [Acidimicrobiales bacterium]